VVRNSLVGYLNFAQLVNIVFLIFIFALEYETIVSILKLFFVYIYIYIYIYIYLKKFSDSSQIQIVHSSILRNFQSLKLRTCSYLCHIPRFVKFIKYQLQRILCIFNIDNSLKPDTIFINCALFTDILIYFMSSLIRKMKDKHVRYLIFRICITYLRILSIYSFRNFRNFNI
jgi:hypothetical protein